MRRYFNPKLFLISFTVSILLLATIGLGVIMALNPNFLSKPESSSTASTDTDNDKQKVLGTSTLTDTQQEGQEENSNKNAADKDVQETVTMEKMDEYIDNTSNNDEVPDNDNDPLDPATPSAPAISGPDLSISNYKVTVNPSTGKATFSVTVKNIGNENARDFYTYLYVDPTPNPPNDPSSYSYRNYNGMFVKLIPGQAYTWSVSGVDLAEGQHKAYFWTDRKDTVSEISETNNIKSKSFQITLQPDLIIESRTVKINPDNTAKVTVSVKNIGSAPARNFCSSVYVDPSPLPPQTPENYEYKYESCVYTSLVPGGDYTFAKDGIALNPGLHSIYFWTDSVNAISESNESNNVKKSTFVIPAPDQVSWDIIHPLCSCIDIERDPSWGSNSMNILVQWEKDDTPEIVTIYLGYGKYFVLEYGDMGKSAPYRFALPHIAGTKDIFNPSGFDHYIPDPNNTSPGSKWTVWLLENL